MSLSVAREFLVWLFNFIKGHAADFKLFGTELLRKPLLLILSVILLVATVGFGYVYWGRASNYESIIDGTLVSETEQTSQSYKGLESFIFSNIPVGKDEILKKQPINPALIEQFKQLQSRIKEIIKNHEISTEASKGILIDIPKVATGDVFTELQEKANVGTDHSEVEGRQGVEQRRGTPGYLFLPAYLVRQQPDIISQHSWPRDTRVRLLTHGAAKKSENKELLLEDDGLAPDVAFGHLIAENLQEMSRISITNDTRSAEVAKYLTLEPAQVYLITSSGTNRIFNKHTRYPSDFYGNQFPANTFFPDRPYYWPTFRDRVVKDVDNIAPKDGASIEEFFHASKPYLDLGGSGIVVTLTKALKIPGLPQAVICIDIQFSPQAGLYKSLETLVHNMSGTVFKINCSVPPDSDAKCEPDDGTKAQALDDARQEMLGAVKQRLTLAQESAERSKILGNLQVLYSVGGKVRFSLPIDQDFTSPIEKATLMVIDVDVNEYRRKTTWVALLAAGCLIGMLSILGSLYTWTVRTKNVRIEDLAKEAQDLQKRTTEFETAFQQVAKVMFHSPTAYVRLNSADQIVDMSASFGALLGIPANEVGIADHELKGRKFKSLCADARSLATYTDVEEKRKAGKEVGAYELTLAQQRGDGHGFYQDI